MSNELKQFRARVESLIKQVKDWAEPYEWVTREYPKKMREGDQEVCEIPALFLQKGPTRVLLDPVAHDVPGAEGVVDLYLMPTYDDMASLYFKNGGWVVHYAFPSESEDSLASIDSESLPLSEETIIKVLNSISLHAEPTF